MIPHYFHRNRSGRIAPLVERMRIYDDDLYAHSILVSRLSWAFAVHLGFSVRDQRLVERAALLHDVGKLHIDVSVLQKPTTLNEQEWAIMRAHPVLGRSLLMREGITDAVMLDVAQNHHERLDGTGYPAGLSGKQVSEVVRVITLCDIYAAVTEARGYAEPYTWQGALERMAQKRARLDLRLLKHFAEMIQARQSYSSSEPREWVHSPISLET